MTEEHSQRNYRLRCRLAELIGMPAVIHTSFSVRNAPIECTVKDGYATLYNAGIDAVVMGICPIT